MRLGLMLILLLPLGGCGHHLLLDTLKAHREHTPVTIHIHCGCPEKKDK